MHWHSNWIVRDTELETPMPCPVCLKDRTQVLFRASEKHQAKLHIHAEAKAVFKMLKYPKRDIFELADGRQFPLGDLPAGLLLDVLVVPGTEHLSDILGSETEKAEESRKEPLLTRLLARFQSSVSKARRPESVADEGSQLVVH
jgi:hypothetical protein